MWRAAGARVSFLSHTEHDQNLATTSHLPHLLAYALMNLVQDGGGVDKLESMMGADSEIRPELPRVTQKFGRI